jgi:hypothetical protein
MGASRVLKDTGGTHVTEKSWIYSGYNGDFNDPNNWSPGGAPAAGDILDMSIPLERLTPVQA